MSVAGTAATLLIFVPAVAVQSKMPGAERKQQVPQRSKSQSEAPQVHMARNNLVILVFIKVIDVKLALLPEAAVVPCAVLTVPEVAAGEQTCILKESLRPWV